MVYRDEPYISSMEQKMDYDFVQKQPLSIMSKLLLEVSEESPDTTINLDENRQYIIPRLA